VALNKRWRRRRGAHGADSSARRAVHETPARTATSGTGRSGPASFTITRNVKRHALICASRARQRPGGRAEDTNRTEQTLCGRAAEPATAAAQNGRTVEPGDLVPARHRDSRWTLRGDRPAGSRTTRLQRRPIDPARHHADPSTQCASESERSGAWPSRPAGGGAGKCCRSPRQHRPMTGSPIASGLSYTAPQEFLRHDDAVLTAYDNNRSGCRTRTRARDAGGPSPGGGISIVHGSCPATSAAAEARPLVVPRSSWRTDPGTTWSLT